MGKPLVGSAEQYEKFSSGDVTVWGSNSVFPVSPGQPITIDLGGFLFFGKRLVVRNAR
jgi:hypothetical protein